MDLTHPSAPVRLNLDTTRRCQLSCWYCHSSSGPDYRGPEIDPALVPDILEAADRHRIFEITITGGEPTMWPGLIPMLEQSPRLKFSSLLLITNALATPPKLLRTVESANLSRICVSLDGLGERHDRNRGQGSYERTLRGIRELRNVHENIAVISVVDATNHTRWPELTYQLAELGVRAHHLTPVCTAGHAITDYRGLDAQQFADVHRMVEQIATEVPEIAVLFNDELVHPLATRTMGIHQFTENWKGWHRIVRPDGEVRTQIRAWGRTWRTPETIGNLRHQKLSQILEEPIQQVSAFTRAEEVARKFRLDANAGLILADLDDINATENGEDATQTPQTFVADVPVPTPLGIGLDDLAGRIRETPDQFRIREEEGFTLLFNTHSHEVHVLTDGENRSLTQELAKVAA
ncbi:radical SAM protein [Nocardia brasiliensis]|uniref:radical SAM protein n=1 Tax=Nocardia brasiliensis TaxID=37326 RepID=UPI0004A73F90|nr:radical SAM protein [Nocardia brasiliensis]